MKQNVTESSSAKITDYIGHFIYEQDTLRSFSIPEGRAVNNIGNYEYQFMLKDHLGNTRVLYGNPFEGNNLLLNTDCNNLEYFLSAQDVTRTLETINGESYIKFVSNQNTSTPGMISTGSINVQPGEKYTFKVKGFRANSADSPAHLYVWSDATENLLWPGANLPYGLENENWVHNDFVIPEGVTSIRLGVLWREGYGLSIGDTFYLNEVALFKHQDDDHTTGFEVSEQSDDALEFNNYQTEKINNTGAYSRSGSSAYRLTGSTQVSNEVIGPAKSIRVYPGDAVHMVVYGKYLPATGSGTNVGAVISGALQNAFGLSSGGATDAAYQSIGNLFGDGAIIGTAAYPDEDEVSPRAFLNYILFDDNYVPYDFGYDQIETAGEMPGGIDKMALVAKVRRPGYIYIYLSNENEVAQEVYFDDLAIKHVKGVAIQQNDYYPFGLAFNSYQRENSITQDYKYNGKEEQTELGLGWLDYGWRMYSPDLGRFSTLDPVAGKFVGLSPYSYCADNPVLLDDPDGRDWSISAYKDKKGQWQIRFTFTGAVLNSSGRNINTANYINQQKAQFTNIFAGIKGNANVSVNFNVRSISSKSDLKSNEHLIEIQDRSNFADREGGNAAYGGKHIQMNERFINDDGTDTSDGDARSLSHEIGHTGGLWHPFKGKGTDGKYYDGFDEKPNNMRFANGNPSNANSQRDVEYSDAALANDYQYANNFMTYIMYAQKRLMLTPDKEIRTNPGKAAPGQIYQILFNYKQGNLNYNDIPK